MSKGYVQDLPPAGGFAPIQVDRIKPRTVLGAKSIILGFIGTSTVGFYLYRLNWKKVKREEVEMRSARFAILPLLLAERDRNVLKHMRRMRDTEAELMKNYKGWEVGTYFGEKIYHHEPNYFVEPTIDEALCHVPWNKREDHYLKYFWV